MRSDSIAAAADTNATADGALTERRTDEERTDKRSAGGFIPTKEYYRFAEFCEACRRERYIGLCYGPAGVGKTLSARHYAKQHLFEDFAPSRYRPWRRGPSGEIPVEAADCHVAFYTPPVANTPRSVAFGLYEARLVLCHIGGLAEAGDEDAGECKLDGRCELVLVDEADRLKTPSLEELLWATTTRATSDWSSSECRASKNVSRATRSFTRASGSRTPSVP